MYYESKKSNPLGLILILLFLIVIIGILVILINKLDASFSIQNIETEIAGTDTVLNDFSIENLVENSIYSVVGVSKLNQKDTSIFLNDAEEKLGVGNGIIVTSDGYILTNYSISGDKKSTCYVTMKNGEVYPANVIWVDKILDISIIKISANNLLTFSLGESDKCSLGEEIYMISNPFGYSIKEQLTTGYISAVNSTTKFVNDNEENYIEDVLKIDKDISNSQTGSPVLNKNGEVIGISSSKINSVIPINRIKNILESLKEDGDFEEAYLGIHGFDNDSLEFLNVDYSSSIGIYVDKVEEQSPVKDKIELGNIILKIDDYELSSMQELYEYLYLKNPGDIVVLEVIKGTKEEKIECELKSK